MIYAEARALALIVDAESGLPNARYACASCGGWVVVVASHEAETVRCTRCGRIDYAGDRAGTITVHRVTVDARGDASYPVAPAVPVVPAVKEKP